jgi:hypothetical protein
MEIEEQHPIPQQVSAYQFKLVGDMTLQQFFQVAGGALVALLIYSSSLPSYVKWPLILVSFLIGVAFAFFPLEDRPLAKWFVLFVKAIYSPTLYVWKKTPPEHSYFQKEPATPPQPITQAQPAPKTNGTKHVGPAKLEIEEKKFLEKVSKDLSSSSAQVSPPPSVATIKKPDIQETKGSQVPIPKAKPADVEHQEKPKIEPEKITQEVSQAKGFKPTPSIGQKVKDTQSAKFSPDASPPLPPTKVNIVVGQVVDPDGKIVESAILEFRDSEGRPARALRSNKLGHFMIVTPLSNGTYQITTEKEGLLFEAISLNVKGEIISPLAIWAKEKIKKETPDPIKV